MYRKQRLPRPVFTIAFILLVLFGPVWSLAAQEAPTAADQVTAAWEKAQTSGAYEFRTIIDQTIYPAPKITNAGKAPQTEKVGIEGAINIYGQAFNLTVWRNATFDPTQGVEMKVEDGQAYARTGLSQWEEVDGFTDNFAPAGNPLNFLAGITNVREGAAASFTLPQAGINQQFTTYQFDIDGTELAAYLRTIMQQQLQARGELPLGMQLGESDAYRKMTGTGTLWVDAEGLPARLSLDLDMGKTETGEHITAVITTEFTDFDTTLLETTIFSNPAMWFETKFPTTAVQQETAINISLFLLLILISFILVSRWREKWVHRFIAIFVILSMILSPVLNGEITHAYYSDAMAEQEQQEADQARYDAQTNAQEALQNNWNPHQDPFTRSNISSKTLPAPHTQTLASVANVSSITITIDSDDDGLSDDAEAFWLTCAYPLNSPEYNASAECTGIADPTDSDGDGLTDGAEVNELDTFPDDTDSDGDAITDTLEIEGFYYNGQQWYLDPNESDTNSDGLTDSQECYVWYPLSDEFDPNGICPDTDADGTPDVFDDDNDNDNVLDMDDLDSDAKGAEIYTHDNPLKVSATGLQTDNPVLMELQFRPTAADHLAYSGLILDWPSGDYEGQIQRALTTTFATTADEDAYSTDSNASYGDIKIFPMLEIYIPYSEGHYGNLPVNSTYVGISRTLGLTVSQWLDTTELDPYGITVVDADETSGDLVAYVPLVSTSSSAGDTTVAFSAQIVYFPTQDSWGADHEYRVTWIVQMITDYCADGVDEDGDGDPDNEDSTECEREDDLSIIHSYEEEWEMTGFSISEEQGYDVTLIYEDPSQDPDLTYDDSLWLYGWNLTNMFITGLDCDTVVNGDCQGDGERDVTLANLNTYLNVWATNENGTDLSYEGVVNKSYPHSGYFSVVAMTDTLDILDSAFTSYASQTYPSILIASETVNRSASLNTLDTVPTGTLTFDMTDVVSLTIAGLSIATYEYDNSTGGWDGVDSGSYLAYLTSTLEEVDYFQAEDDSDESVDEAEGKLIWAQSFYTALANGQGGYVETGGESYYTPTLIEEDAETLWEQTAVSLNVLSNGLIAKKLAGTFSYMVQQQIQYGTTITTQKLWASVKSLYSVSNYSVTSELTGMKSVRVYSLSKYAPDNKLLFKVTRDWSARIIGVTGALFLVGAALYVTSLLIEDGTTADILSIVGQSLIAVSSTILVSLEITAILAKLKLISRVNIAHLASEIQGLAKTQLTELYRYYAKTGYAIGLAVTWGLFLFQLSQIGWNTHTFLFDIILIYAIVGTIFETLIFIIGLFFPVGTIITLIYTIIELILTIISLFTDDVDSIQGMVAEALVEAIYNVDVVVNNFSSDDRLEFDTDYGLLDTDLGYVPDNSLLFTMTVTNTIVGKQNFNTLATNTFVYALQETETDLHDDLDIEQMEADWQLVPDLYRAKVDGEWQTFDGARLTETLTTTLPFFDLGTGINEDIPAFYLTEAYALSIESCWQIIWEFGCELEGTNGSSHFELDYLTFDILPDTLTEFVALNWANVDMPFPDQMDQDGDGLLNELYGGVDPDDTQFDSDGDNLSDYYEISYGYDPQDADTDNDGLSDAEEAFIYYTDPTLADSDGDTLSDYLEVKQGWLVGYTAADGSTQVTRVWSNPYATDNDLDDLDDLKEFVFGFHPELATDANALQNVVQFDDIQVNETDAPLLLLQMEAEEGDSVFTDNSGEGNNATCDWTSTTCPTVVDGMYGNGLSFDGANDKLVISDTNSLDFGTESFTVAAWVKTNSFTDWQNIVSKKDGQGTAVGWTLRLDPNNRATMFVANGTNLWRASGSSTMVAGTWYHVAGVVDSEQDAIYLYVDGSLADTKESYTGDVSNLNWPMIGTWDDGSNPDFFDGLIDEVLVYDRALSSSEIVDVMNGRYNTNDLIVRTGAELTYQATVTNTSVTQEVNGFLIGQTQVITPALPPPLALYNFDQEQRLAYFANNNGEENASYCYINTCPTTGVQGSTNKAVEFDGDDDYVVVPTLLQDQIPVYEVHFDIKLDSLPAAGSRMYVFDTAEEVNGALDIYIDDTGYMIFDVQGDTDPGDRPTINMNSSIGTWQSIDVYTSSWNPDTTTLGYGYLGNSVDGTSGLDGSIDEWVIHANDQETDLKYTFDTLASYDGDIFYDTQTAANHGICSDPACPATTLENGNRYLDFDGADDTFYTSGTTNLEEFTLSFYVYIDAYPSSTTTLYDGQNINISLNSSGQVVVDRTGSYDNTSDTSVPLGAWSTISLEYDEYISGGNCYYRSRLTVNGTTKNVNHHLQATCSDHSVTIGNAWFGSNNGSSNYFNGRLDDVSVEFAAYDFDPQTSNVKYLNRVTERAESSCADVFSCPLSATGIFNEGLSFDGIEQYMSLGQILNPAEGDFTIAIWFNPDSYGQVRHILQQQDDSGTGRVWLGQYANGQLYTSLGGADLAGTQIPTINEWHHGAVVYEQDTLYLYLDGELVNSSQISMESNDGDVILGRENDTDNYFFNGLMDELVVFDAALSPAAIQFLMTSQLPVIDVPDKFITFSAPALSSVEVSGSATVNEHADSSVSQFDQEVEAALELQDGVLVFPTYSNTADSLDLYMPFEDAPGSTSFKNLSEYISSGGTNYGSFDPYCVDSGCPTAGLRGQIGRSIYFDGIDDYITVDFTDVYQFADTNLGTISLWVNAKQGTILQTEYNLEIDMKKITGQYDSITYSLPRDEWFHLALVTQDPTSLDTHLYINGTLVATSDDMVGGSEDSLIILGRNEKEFDYLEGYIDDLRIYNDELTASEVQTLYEQSAPVFRFEFDEESSASVFVDNSTRAYVGVPDYETCTNLTIDSLTVNGISSNTDNFYVAVDGDWLIYDASDNDSIGTQNEMNVSTTACDNFTLSVGVVNDTETATVLGTLNLNASSGGGSSHLFSSGSDSIQINYTIDSDLTYQPNPIPGTDGQIGNTALFDGNGVIQVPDTTVPLNLTDEDFTLMAWIKTDQSGKVALFTKGDGDTNLESGEKAFYFNNGEPTFLGYANGYIIGSTVITDSLWHHVAVVWDFDGSGSNGWGGTGYMFVDGVDVTSTDSYQGRNTDVPTHILRFGDNFGQFSQQFIGQMDEFAAYQYALTDVEIYNTYLLELRWYRDNATYQVVVDEDSPTVEMLSTYPYRADDYIQLVADVQDATSAISLARFGLKRPGESDFTWETAVACSDSNVAYCPAFISSGEGTYEVQLRVVDAVGNETISDPYSFYIDDTAPIVGQSSGLLVPSTTLPFTLEETSNFDWTITLTGTVNDPDIDLITGSGVVTSGLSVTIIDERGAVLGSPNQAVDSLINDTWTMTYDVFGMAPVGTYTVTVTAQDVLGNSSTTALGTIDLDERSTSTQFANLLPAYALSGTQTITGVVYDYPTWYGLNLSLHFEENSGATLFYDHGRFANHATCTTCPAATTDTPFGRALHFNGIDHTLVISGDQSLNEELNNDLTIALWVKADATQNTADGSVNVLLSTWEANEGGYTIAYANQSSPNEGQIVVTWDDGTNSTVIQSNGRINDSAFHHLVVARENGTFYLYIDGHLDTTIADITADTSHNNLIIGALGDNSSHFSGILDEILIMNRALMADQLYILAQDGVNGVGQVELALEPVDFSTLSTPLDEDAQVWQTATLAQSNTAATEWSYNLASSGLEDYYRIHLRSQDSVGNREAAGTIWQGIIDDLAPRATLTAELWGSSANGYTEYSFTAEDLFMDLASVTAPCGSESMSLGYDDTTGNLAQLSGMCRLPGHDSTPISFTVCDYVNHCTTLNVSPTAVALDTIAILTPTHNSAITSTGVVPISGVALADNGIDDIAIQVNGTLVDVLSFGGSITGTAWTTSNWSPATSGAYTITAVLTDTINTVITDSINLDIIALTCFTEYTGDNVTDFASADATGVQNAVDAAPAGTTIKIAGYCPGVQNRNGYTQTVYLYKTVTLQGGYDQNNWLAESDPVTYPTVLDAQGNGRVIFLLYYATVTNAALDGLTLINGDAYNNSVGNCGDIGTQGGGAVCLGSANGFTIRNSIIRDSTARNGAGIYRHGGGNPLLIENTTIAGNTAVNGLGGGIYQRYNGLALTNSTVSGNTASSNGGGIYMSRHDLWLTNSTISGNSAGGHGGGIYTNQYGGTTTTITHTSIVSNTAGGDGGGLYSQNITSTLSSSLLAYNSDGGSNSPDCAGTITSGDYNLLTDTTGCTFTPAANDLTGVDPLLAALADNGGDTETHALLDGSPAIEHIPAGTNGCGTDITTDQRGGARPQGLNCDIGAYEFGMVALFVVKDGTGSGLVNSTLTEIDCGITCSVALLPGTPITLTAVPDPFNTFTGWSGTCSGSGDCALTVNSDEVVTATFTLNQYDLNVTTSGNGSGSISSDPAGINCPTDCTEPFDYGTAVTLTATADMGSSFTSWSGDCSGSGDCVVTIGTVNSVTATFTLNSYDLNVAVIGVGEGTVASNPGGIVCEPVCSEAYEYGTVVTLTAVVPITSTFTSWSGDCTGNGDCVLTIGLTNTVTATFSLNQYDLTVVTSGNGSGSVSSGPAGINCPNDCTEAYAYGTVVTLTAVANTGSSFTGWSGDCIGSGDCVVTIDLINQVTATFALNSYDLNVAVTGNGNGTISSDPVGISCPSDCTEAYDYGTAVTLTATYDPNASALVWGGACSSASGDTCLVTIDLVNEVTATFTLNQYSLGVVMAGNGSGDVSSDPAGIACQTGGGQCTAAFDYGTVVTVMAVADTHSTFTGWSGICTGTGNCVVTMDEAKLVTATFTLDQHELGVTLDGTGGGTVTSIPSGIDCGADCSESFDYGTVVTVTAVADTHAAFTGWSGICTGTGNCIVTMDETKLVTATFTLDQHELSVTLDGTGGGTVTSNPTGIYCGTDCSESFDYGTVVTLTAVAETGSIFTGWSGACTGTDDCTVTMDMAQSVTAIFTLKQTGFFIYLPMITKP